MYQIVKSLLSRILYILQQRLIYDLKGLFTDLALKKPFPLQEYLLLTQFLGPTVDFMVSRIGPKLSTTNSNGVIGPILGTIKSILATAGIVKNSQRLK